MGALCDLESTSDDNTAPHVVKGDPLSLSRGNFSRRNLQKRPGGGRQSYPGAHVSDSLARRN